MWFCCFGFSHNTCNISLILFIFLFIPFGVSFSLFPSCKNQPYYMIDLFLLFECELLSFCFRLWRFDELSSAQFYILLFFFFFLGQILFEQKFSDSAVDHITSFLHLLLLSIIFSSLPKTLTVSVLHFSG